MSLLVRPRATRFAAWLLALGSACLGACREPVERTQTIITVDADAAVRDAVTGLSVEVKSVEDGTLTRRPSTMTPTWPIQLVFAPLHDDASRAFELRLSLERAAGKGDGDLGLRIRTGFVPGEKRFVSVFVEASCLDPELASCTSADCNYVTVMQLGETRENPARVKLSCIDGREPMTPSGSDGGSAGTDAAAGEGAGGAGTSSDEAGSGARDATYTGGKAAPAGGAPARGGAGGTKGGGTGGVGGAAGSTAGCTQPPCAAEACAANPCGQGTCVDQPDEPTPYTCECDPGYRFEGATCVIECRDNSWRASDGQSCMTLQASYTLSTGASVRPCHPQFAFDASGNGLAAWVQWTDTQASLWIARYVAGMGWQPAVQVPSAVGAYLGSARVALDDRNAGLVIWMQRGAMYNELWYARYTGSDNLGEPKRVSTNTTGTSTELILPDVALSGGGDGFVTWTALEIPRAKVWIKRWVADDAAFGAGVPFSDEGDRAAMWSRVALDATGRANVVWTSILYDSATTAYSEPKAWLAHFDPATGWGDKLLLDRGTALIPDVATAPSGASAVIWEALTVPMYRTTLQRLDGATLSAKPELLSTARSDEASVGPRVAVGSAGEAVATWTEVRNKERTIWGSTASGPSAAWSAPTLLSQYAWPLPTAESEWPLALLLEPPADVALDARGNGFAVITEYDSSNMRVVTLRRVEAAHGFGEYRLLQTDTRANVSSFANVAVDAQGRAVVIWDRPVGAQTYEVVARRIE